MQSNTLVNTPVRRLVCVCLLVVSALASTLARGEGGLADRLNVLKDAADALGAAGDAVTKLTDGVAHLVATGDKGWQVVSARRVRSHLVSVSARARNLSAAQHVLVDVSIKDYLAKPHPTAADWQPVATHIGAVIGEVKKLLDDLKTEHSDFVLEQAYASLLETLEARSSILDRLQSLTPPQTTEERAALRKLDSSYKTLLDRFDAALIELNKYIEGTP